MLLKTSKLLLLLLFGTFMVAPGYAAGTVGSGSPASCTEAALNAALAGGGTVTFNCGPASHTIVITSEKLISAATVIDGAGLITLDAGGNGRILHLQTGQSLTVRGLTLINGFTALEGGAIYAEELTSLTVEDSTFSGNVSTQLAENYAGGGAISVERRSTAVISGSSFNNNQAGNGGAIAIGGWDTNDDGGTIAITDSSFTNNTATEDGSIPGGGDGGGAVYLKGGAYGTVSGSTFTGNQAANGGAIHMLNAGVLITNSTFNNNVANHNFGNGGGGAIYMDGGDDQFTSGITIQTSTFTGNNTNLAGGAIFSFPEGTETTHITHSTFDGNFSHGRGQAGAIYHQSANGNGPLLVENSTFMYNDALATIAGPDAASQGGALWLINAPVTINNSTFYANDASDLTLPADDWHRGFGGALVAHTLVTINNSTFAYNTAGFVGGAIAPANPNVITMQNSIIAHNSGANPWGVQPNCTQGLIDGGNNLQFPAGECLAGQNADPLLGTFGDYGGDTQTLPLLTGSPAINAGNNATCTPVDQRGVPRQGVCDIGAYEFGASLQISSISPPFAELNSAEITLTVTGIEFTPQSVVRWQGVNRATTYVSPLQLTAVIPTADLDALGTFAVTVYDAGADEETTAVSFQVVTEISELYLPVVQKP